MEAELTEFKLGKARWLLNCPHAPSLQVLGTYRSFKFPLDADPQYPPDIFSNASTDGNLTTTSVYASWNGATKVASWTLYKTDENGDKILMLNSAVRSGFETSISCDGYAKYVFVQARDANGESLGESAIVETIIAEDISNDAVADELIWLRYGGDSESWITRMMDTSLATFVAGMFCGVTIIVLILFARGKGLFSFRHRGLASYNRVAVADTADFDETRLDDLTPSRSYRDKSYDDASDEGDRP